jgi:hypothetical protein
VERGPQAYEPLPGPKVVVDAVASVDENLELVRRHLAERASVAPRP